MNINMLVQYCKHLLCNSPAKEWLPLLQQQRRLLYSGIEGSAEVIHSFMYMQRTGGLHRVQLWLKLKKADGSFLYTHTHTFVVQNKIPVTGNIVRIRYRLDNLSEVIILNS
jgi:hypothetical protein